MRMEGQSKQDLPLLSSDGGLKDSLANRLLDDLGHEAGRENPSTRLGNCPDAARETLPRLSLYSRPHRYVANAFASYADEREPVPLEQTEKKVRSLSVGTDVSLHGDCSGTEQVLPSGDTLRLGRGYQSLVLASGERISINKSGAVTMIDASDRVVTMTEKRMTPPDVVPSLVEGEFSNGVQMTHAGGVNVLAYPDGTRVYLDRTGLRALDRENGVRIQLDSQRPDFDFRAFN